MTLIAEAIFVGITLPLFVFAAAYLLDLLMPDLVPLGVATPDALVFLAIMGVLYHLLAEATGVNAWYCVNGNACA